MEASATAKYTIDIDQARVIAIGDGASITQQVREKWLIEESLADVRSGTFAPPSNGQALLDTLHTQHLLVLCGANRMGKATLARFLAACMHDQEPDRQVLRLRHRGELHEILDPLSVKRNLIVLAYDVDHAQAEPLLETLRETARSVGNQVILTSDARLENWTVPPECAACLFQVTAGSPYTRSDLERLLAARLDAQLGKVQGLGLSVRRLTDTLASPSQIVRFAEMLFLQSESPDKEGIEELIQLLQDTGLEVNRWYQKLDKDQRYLALVLALFGDLPERAFWKVYERLVSVWQKRDPTLIPLDYYGLEALRPLVGLEPRISFKEPDHRDAVLGLCLGQYRRALVKALPALRQVVKPPSGRRRAGTTLRITTAQAVGQIGTVEWAAIEPTLRAWAVDDETSIRAAAGHALRQTLDYGGRDHLPHILRLLDQWYESHSPPDRDQDTEPMCNVRWTVASSLGRLGTTVSEAAFDAEIYPRLGRLIRDENYRVRASTIYTLQWLAFQHFARIRPLLGIGAADWHPRVRRETVQVLEKLSVTRWPDMHDLIFRWLHGQDPRRHKTALRAVWQLGPAHPELANDLYDAAGEVPDLSSTVQTEVVALLDSEEEAEEDVSTMLALLIRRAAPVDSHLLIDPLVHALDYSLAHALYLVDAWQDPAYPERELVIRTVLKELGRIRDQRMRQWERLVNQYLYDTESLQAFAETLPPEEREAFWQDVRARRADAAERWQQEEERKRQEERDRQARLRLRRRNTVVLVTFGVIFFCCFVCVFGPLLNSCRGS